MTDFYQHLGLTDWPFTVVPRPQHCTFIAGRDQFRNDIAALLQTLTRRDVSTIQTLWSSLGAGKTHSLYYLAYTANQLSSTSIKIPLMPIYTEFPKGAKGFRDLYCTIIAAIDIGAIIEAYLEVSTSPQGNKFQQYLMINNPDLESALRIFVMDEGQNRAIPALPRKGWFGVHTVVGKRIR